MEQQLKLQNKEKFEKNQEKNVQTVIETETDLTTDKVNIELAERKVTTTKEEKIVDGEEKTVIDIDESKDVQEFSFNRLDKKYQKRIEDLNTQTKGEETENNESHGNVSKPKVVFIRIETPQRKNQHFSEEFDSVEVADSTDLQPSLYLIAGEDETREFDRVQETESLETTGEETDESLKLEEERLLEENMEEYTEGEAGDFEEEYEDESNQNYEEDNAEALLGEKTDEEEDNQLGYQEESIHVLLEEKGDDEDYAVDFDEFELDISLEEGTVSPEFIDDASILESLDEFEGLEENYFASNGVLKADYDSSENSEGVSERVIVSLDNFQEYDSIEGSEIVEYLDSNTALDATVVEIPYFSENSGESWESGWNSFDMIVQMGDMNFQNMEYMVSELGQQRNNPAKQSIDSEFDSSKVLEFRESQEWSNHDGGYEASQETKDAWQERYGEEVMELDDIERGIYAAIVEGKEFRGSDLDLTEMGLEHGEILQEAYLEREAYSTEISPEVNDGGLSTAPS